MGSWSVSDHVPSLRAYVIDKGICLPYLLPLFTLLLLVLLALPLTLVITSYGFDPNTLQHHVVAFGHRMILFMVFDDLSVLALYSVQCVDQVSRRSGHAPTSLLASQLSCGLGVGMMSLWATMEHCS